VLLLVLMALGVLQLKYFLLSSDFLLGPLVPCSFLQLANK
jgi:hypothetical protein